ncbi:hypothetical protein GGR58DRAFT_517113 [Xylaria digitata]|nr:hypothetical protein GGR58DRAFT_517113 [Xylaria digitata]
MDFSFQALVQRHAVQMNTAFRGLANTIVKNSKLNISLLRITNVTEESFHVSLEARITGTGPVTAIVTRMPVELCGPSGHFGNMTLPAMRTQPYGTDIVVTSQLVDIIDKEALKVFIQNIIDEGVILSLRNGRTTITAMGVGPRGVVYENKIELGGMNGPFVRVHEATIVQNSLPAAGPSTVTLNPTNTTAPNGSSTTTSVSSTAKPSNGNNSTIVLHVVNPSPLEISFGTCCFDIENHEGETLAELKGRLDMRHSQFEFTLQGIVNKAAVAKLAADMRAAARGERRANERVNDGEAKIPEARLVGKRCGGAGWCDDTIKGINVPLYNVRKLFRAVELGAVPEPLPPPPPKKGGFTKWTQRWMIR